MAKITYKSVSSVAAFTVDDRKTSLPFFLEKTEFNDTQIEHDSYTAIGYDGGLVSGAKLKPLPLSFTFGVAGQSYEDLKASVKTARMAFSPKEEALLTYYKDEKEYFINCFLQSAPVVTLHNQLYATITISLIAPFPFWRTVADDITLTCSAGETQSISFTASTDYEVPAFLYIACGSDMTGTATEAAIITLTATKRRALFGRIPTTGSKNPTTQGETQNTRLYISKNLSRNDSFFVDWGVQGRFFTNADDEIDFIRSSIQYVYPGANRLTASVASTSGNISVVLRRFDYVKAV